MAPQDMLSERLVAAEAAVRGRTMRVLELEGKVDELTRQLSDARKAGAMKDVECERLVARHEAAAAEAEELAEQLSLKQNEVGRLEEALSSGPATLGAVAACPSSTTRCRSGTFVGRPPMTTSRIGTQIMSGWLNAVCGA